MYAYIHACICVYIHTRIYNILYYTIVHYTSLYYTILYYTILYYTILYCNIRLLPGPPQARANEISGASTNLAGARRTGPTYYVYIYIYIYKRCTKALWCLTPCAIVCNEHTETTYCERWYSYPYPCHKEFYKLPTAPISSTQRFYKLSWAWAWVRASQPMLTLCDDFIVVPFCLTPMVPYIISYDMI